MIEPRNNETERVRVKKPHMHRRVLCGPDTDNPAIYLRPDQARRLKARGIVEAESQSSRKSSSASESSASES